MLNHRKFKRKLNRFKDIISMHCFIILLLLYKLYGKNLISGNLKCHKQK